jgi:hypothetical protein
MFALAGDAGLANGGLNGYWKRPNGRFILFV